MARKSRDLLYEQESRFEEDPDLFIDPEKLASIARRALGGRLPPNFRWPEAGGGRDGSYNSDFAEAEATTWGNSLESTSAAAPPKPKRSKGPPPPSLAVARQLQREMDARGWTVRDLAEAIGVSPSEARGMARGTVRVTRQQADELGRVFATSSDLWLGAID